MKFKNKLCIAITLPFLFLSLFFYKIYAVSYPKPYRAEMRRHNGIDENLVYAVIKAESGFRRNAKSDAGAVGLMQIMPATAFFVRQLYALPDGDLFEPSYNILIGTHYLQYLFEKFDSLKTVLASYNAGEGRVLSWLNDEHYSTDGKNLYHIPFEETKNYVDRVEKNYKIYRFFY